MSLSFKDLYLTGAYPPMCHPTADPSVFGGADPGNSRILEIGCGTGHHMLSLASRWPEADCTGVDVSGRAISKARSLARRAGLANAKFCECSLLEFEPEGTFDFIIAHGVFSWVPDEVKIHLLDFIGKRLSGKGAAVVSFNVAAGWKARMRVVEKVLAIRDAGCVDEMTALSVFKTVAEGKELEIAGDMLAKGPEVLAFDDFAPVIDAWSLGAFLKLADTSGLRWLGDSISGEMGTDAGDTETGTTFRSETFSRKDSSHEFRKIPSTPESSDLKIPDFPALDPWRMLCVLEGLTVPDKNLNPCRFSTPQLQVMAAMDGTQSHVRLAEHAATHAPRLDFVAFLKHLTERGMFA